MRFVFPNALRSDEAALPIEIACDCGQQPQLEKGELDKFNPAGIGAAYTHVFARSVPERALKYVSISSREEIGKWRGNSGQLAVFLSLASLLCAKSRLPPGFRDNEVVWATGEINDNKSGSFGVHEIERLKEKLLAFEVSAPSVNRFFLLPARSLEELAERPKLLTKSLREFIDYVSKSENRLQEERFLVVLERTDLESLGCLFAGDIDGARRALLRAVLSPKAHLPGIAYKAYPNLCSEAYGALIERFHAEYVGAPEDVPFGGRAAELADLDAWLNDVNGTPFRLLTAEAGAGKSAVVAQWVASLESRENLSIVYVPISQRFGTSDAGDYLRSLALQLAHVRGAQLDERQNTSIRLWESHVSKLLSRSALDEGHQVLVVLDGIDEGVGGSNWRAVLPKHVARGVRVCLSARLHLSRDDARAWMLELGLNPSVTSLATLGNLNRDAIVDILRHSASRMKLLANHEDFVDAFCEVTEQQPLIVRLLLAQLSELDLSEVTTARLKSMKRGIAGVVAREIESQVQADLGESEQQDTVRVVLGILASAVDSVTDDALFELALLANDAVTRAALATALTKLRRLLRANEAGTGFCHPRLLSYVRGEAGTDVRLLSEIEVREWDDRIVNWGKAKLAHAARGNATDRHLPLYVLRHHSTHLSRVRASSEEWLTLLHPSVLRAHRERVYHLRHFCSDVERVLAVLAAEDDERQKVGQGPRRLMEQLRCGLLLSAAREDANAVTPGLLQAAVATGYWSVARARASALDHPNSDSRAACLIAAAAAMQSSTESQSCAELLQAAEFALSHEPDTFVRLLVERLLVEQSSDIFARLALDRLAETRAELFLDVRECFMHAALSLDRCKDWRAKLEETYRQLVDPIPPFERRSYSSYNRWFFGNDNHVPSEYWADRGSLSSDRIDELRTAAERFASARVRARALLMLADASCSSQTRDELENESLALLSRGDRVAWRDRELVAWILTNSPAELIRERLKWLRLLRDWRVRYRVLRGWLERGQEGMVACVLGDVLAVPDREARAHLLVLFAQRCATLHETTTRSLLQTLNEGIAHRSNLPVEFRQTLGELMSLVAPVLLGLTVLAVWVKVSSWLAVALLAVLVFALVQSVRENPAPDVLRTLAMASRVLSIEQADTLARQHFPRFRGRFFNRHLAADVTAALAQRVSSQLVLEYFALVTKTFHVKERQVLDAIAPRLSLTQVQFAIQQFARSVDRLPSIREVRYRLKPVPSGEHTTIRTAVLIVKLLPLLILMELIKNHVLSLRGLIGLVLGVGLVTVLRRPFAWTYVRFLAARRADQDWRWALSLLEFGRNHVLSASLLLRCLSQLIAEERVFDLWRTFVCDRTFGRLLVDLVAVARRMPNSQLGEALRLLYVGPVLDVWPSLVELAPRFAQRLPVDSLIQALSYRLTHGTGERDDAVQAVIDFAARALGELDEAGFDELCLWCEIHLSTQEFSRLVSRSETLHWSSRRRLVLFDSVLRGFSSVDVQESVVCLAGIANLLSSLGVKDADAKVDSEVRRVERLLSFETIHAGDSLNWRRRLA